MKQIIIISLFLHIYISFGQVGIGTTTPEASAQIDITASDKGVLIPRVNLSSVNDTSLDGTHTAVEGLVIYNTNTSLSGGKGFYYFDGNIWQKLVINPNNIHVVPIDTQSVYIDDINYPSGKDVSGYDSALEPIFFNPQGKLEVKLIVRYSSATGNIHFQLRAHDNTHEVYPITNADFGIYAATQNGGVATSDWVEWDAGTNAYEIHLFAWADSGANCTVESAYLLVRSQ